MWWTDFQWQYRSGFDKSNSVRHTACRSSMQFHRWKSCGFFVRLLPRYRYRVLGILKNQVHVLNLPNQHLLPIHWNLQWKQFSQIRPAERTKRCWFDRKARWPSSPVVENNWLDWLRCRHGSRFPALHNRRCHCRYRSATCYQMWKQFRLGRYHRQCGMPIPPLRYGLL